MGALQTNFAPMAKGVRGRKREEFFEDGAVDVRFARLWRSDRETLGGVGHPAVRYPRLGPGLEGVDPAVADSVGELFLVAPEDVVRQPAFEGLAQYGFFHFSVAGHLVAGMHAHGDVKEVAVKHLVSGSGYTCDLALTRDAFGRRAQEALEGRVREQGGSRNREEAVTNDGELVPVEVVDPEDGTTHVEYRRRAPARPANTPPPPPDDELFGDDL